MLKKTAIALSVATLATGAVVLPTATVQAAGGPGAVQLAACAPACGACAAKKAACAACNPCAAKKAACAPCNPCAAKKAACSPCNPCAAKSN